MQCEQVLIERAGLPARLFRRDIGPDLSAFHRDGYAVLRDFVDADFLSYCESNLRGCLAEGQSDRDIPGKKSQFVLDWPRAARLRDELFFTAAALLRCAADAIVLSERHFHVYSADAPARPLPHKDRAATQLAIGIPLDTGDSALMLFPDASPANVIESAVGLRRALDGCDARIADFMARAPAVRLDTKRGDAIAFLGSRIFHERYDAAGTAILYLKLNNFGADPLGEHIVKE
jgi:hypothetical protein